MFIQLFFSRALDDGFKIDNLKPDKLTHINYAFANAEKDGSVVLEVDIMYPLLTQVLTTFYIKDANSDKANFIKLKSLKEKYRNLKVSLSVGGWSGSASFPSAVSDTASRQRFARTVMDHITNLGLDGVDIDWEYPQNNNEADNYTLLLKEIRSTLDDYQKKNSVDPFLISVAVPAGPEDYKKLKLKDMNNYVDFFYLMTYDLAGDFDDVTGYQSALYNGGKMDVNQAIKGYQNGGVPSKKIVMGIPVYGRGFSNTQNKIGASFHGVPKGEGDDEGMYAYKHLPQPNAVEHYDADKVASWSYDEGKKEFVTYDNPAAVEAKCDYIQKNGLGGAMLWEISEDADGKRSLLDTIYGKIGNNMAKTNNHIVYSK